MRAIYFGCWTRSDILRRTGLSAPAVTDALARLLLAGLVEERTGHRPSAGARVRLYCPRGAPSADALGTAGRTLSSWEAFAAAVKELFAAI